MESQINSLNLTFFIGCHIYGFNCRVAWHKSLVLIDCSTSKLLWQPKRLLRLSTVYALRSRVKLIFWISCLVVQLCLSIHLAKTHSQCCKSICVTNCRVEQPSHPQTPFFFFVLFSILLQVLQIQCPAPNLWPFHIRTVSPSPESPFVVTFNTVSKRTDGVGGNITSWEEQNEKEKRIMSVTYFTLSW